MSTLTKTAALRQAAANYGQVYKVGSGNCYGYSTWSRRHQAWWLPSSGTTYTSAVANRCAGIAASAYEIYTGIEHDDPASDSWRAWDLRGSAASRLNQLLRMTAKSRGKAA